MSSNKGIATKDRCQLSVWRWETDAQSGLHLEDPQDLVDEKDPRSRNSDARGMTS
jgi:hypothetical protein